MFGKLKEKLKSWTKKVATSSEVKKDVAPQSLEESSKENQEVVLQDKAEEKVETTKEELDQIKEKTKKEVGKKASKEVKEEFNKETKKPESTLEEISELEKTPRIEKSKKSFFSKKIKISEKDFENHAEELELVLLENNVALEVVDKILAKLKEAILDKEIEKKNLETKIQNSIKKIIEEILIEPFDLIQKIQEKKEKPFVILFCGINGSGKTTTIAKVANLLQKNNLSCVFAAADTFRSAAIEQIKKHGEKLGIEVIAHEYNSDPAAVGFDAIKFAKKNNKDVVLIDTAGRIHTDKNLMNQITKIAKVCDPDMEIFIGEAITGNDSVEQVKAFDRAVNLDGIILTKADVDEKGGTALSLGEVTGKPILFLGTGQEYDKLEKFDKDKFIQSLGLDQ